MLTCFVCKMKCSINIQKFKTICNKYAKKTRGCQKKAVFTENNAENGVGGTLQLSICYAFLYDISLLRYISSTLLSHFVSFRLYM